MGIPGSENLMASQQSSISRGDVRMRAFHSPEAIKMTDSSSDFNHQNNQFNVSQPITGMNR